MTGLFNPSATAERCLTEIANEAIGAPLADAYVAMENGNLELADCLLEEADTRLEAEIETIEEKRSLVGEQLDAIEALQEVIAPPPGAGTTP